MTDKPIYPQTDQIDDLRKVVRPGMVKIGGHMCSIFVEIEIKNGRLSMSGVEGPTPNGNAMGSSGQIEMGYKHRIDEHDDRRYKNPIKPETSPLLMAGTPTCGMTCLSAGINTTTTSFTLSAFISTFASGARRSLGLSSGS